MIYSYITCILRTKEEAVILHMYMVIMFGLRTVRKTSSLLENGCGGKGADNLQSAK